MNTQEEFEFAEKVVQKLNQSTREIDAQTSAKIRDARSQALACFHVSRAGAWCPQWAADRLNRSFEPISRDPRRYLAVVVLLASISGVVAWHTVDQEEGEYAEIDQALLTDELPVVAYLDQDFGLWVKRLSRR